MISYLIGLNIYPPFNLTIYYISPLLLGQIHNNLSYHK